MKKPALLKEFQNLKVMEAGGIGREKLVRAISLLITLGLLASCNWNSSENRSLGEVYKAEKEETPAQDSAYLVNLIAADHTFDMPSEIPSGWITFRMVNTGLEQHVAMLGRKPDTLETTTFLEAIEEGTWPPFEYAGGPGFHSPGSSSETTVFMKPGDYFIGCGANTAEGKNHSAIGMINHFRVTEEPSGAPEPEADGVLTLDKFRIDADLMKTSGRKTIRIEHKDHPMDIHLIKLDEESTLPELISYFHDLRDPTPINFLGGAEQTEVGNVSYVTIDFQPGEYVWMSQEYGAWGMQFPFEVLDDGMLIKSRSEEEVKDVQKVDIEVRDGALEIFNRIAGGRTKLVFRSSGEEKHNLEINRLKREATEKSALAWYEAWIESREDELEYYPFLGFWITVEPESEREIILDIKPDKYLIHCTGVDEAGKWHWNQGEATVFTVPGDRDGLGESRK